MWKIVLLVVVVLVVGVLVAAAMRPNDFSLQRTASIRAPAAKIHPFIDDFRQWPAWSPWEHIDPTMKRTLSGAPSGVGAVYAWEGSGKAGAGRMEIKESSAPSRVGIQLDFLKPFEAHNVAEFTLVPQGDSTEVTWVMRGPSPFVSKLMGVFISMDTMVGKDFEKGLANLKAVAEK